MNRLSKFQTILLIIFGALCVSGVLIFAFAVGGGSSNTVGPVTIWGTLDQNAFTTVIRAAAENNPQLSQVTYEQKDDETFEAELTNALASGMGPDLFLLRQDYAMKHAAKIASIPYDVLPESQYATTFAQASKTFMGLSGVLAIPLSVDPLVMYWNRDLLANGGYAKPPVYWDEILPMASYVTGANDEVNKSSVTRRDQQNSVKKSAVAFGEYRNVDSAKDILAMLIMQAGGSITTRDQAGKVVPAISPRTGEAAFASDSALRFFTEFADPSKNHYSWNRSLPSSRAAFAAGDLGIYIGYASEEPLLRRMNPNLNFAIASMPQIRPAQNGDLRNYLNFGRVYGFAISRASDNLSGAQVIAYTLASAENSKNLSLALGIPSARVDLLSAQLPDPNSLAQKTLGAQAGQEQVVSMAAIIARSWMDPDPEKTNEIFKDMIENTSSGVTRVADSVQRADQELGFILGL